TDPHGWIVDRITAVRETPRRHRRSKTVPSVAELESEGLIAPDDDPHRYFDQRERSIAEWLAANGVHGLRSVRRRHGHRRRTPDGIFDRGNSCATIEMKAPSAATADGVRRNTRVGTEQSRIVVLDFRGSGLDLATGIDGVRRVVRQNGNDLDQLIVMLKGNSRLGWKP
ncbi:MAG TPA: hypothetical protein VFQ37_08105, partial [Mycobacterium sp.]|nr:hypothetical protein [Mycobacterium sp.]